MFLGKVTSNQREYRNNGARNFSRHQYSNVQSPITRTNDPAVQQFHNCTVNIQNYFGPQSTNQASSSRVECQIGEITSPSIPRRKRKRAYIMDSDEDWILTLTVFSHIPIYFVEIFMLEKLKVVNHVSRSRKCRRQRFEISRPITPWIVRHEVLLPLEINR